MWVIASKINGIKGAELLDNFKSQSLPQHFYSRIKHNYYIHLTVSLIAGKTQGNRVPTMREYT